MSDYPLDLVVLVADKDAAETFRNLLPRHQSLAIRPITFEVHQLQGKDAATFQTAPSVARVYLRQAAHVLVVFDHHGSGQDQRTPDELEEDVTKRLHASGWSDRGRCLVLAPELEQWVWSDSPHVDDLLGWPEQRSALRRRLADEQLWEDGQAKPSDPKRAVELALSWRSISWSASIHGQIAAKVSLRRCTEPSFIALRELLSLWFPFGQET